MDKIKAIHMGPAKCAVDLGDGSERGEYVNQDYILHKLGRPHRAVNLMYCYYPLDKEWPGRISEVMKDANVSFQWDYPYDDYFPYGGGIGGNTEGEPFNFMRDIRKHGQDVILTLTIDPNVSDEHLIKIAEELKTFGRIQMRINHEATGNWFSFTKRTTYQGVADFYVRFHKIIKEHAPNVSTILCIGGIEDLSKTEIEMEKEFSEAVKVTDIWSVDKYMALHWGWPYDVAEEGGTSFGRSAVSEIYEKTKRSYLRFKEICGGQEKPMVMSEFNADGDVTGPFEQAEMVQKFCDMLKADKDIWLNGFTFYQFRDRGRLGLEIEDPNNPDVGIEQPEMQTYKEIIHDDFFYPEIEETGNIQLPAKLRWGGSEDAEGIAIPLHFEKNPVFCEVTFDEEVNLMMEINGKWFYKSPKAKTIDLMSAFYEKPLDGAADLTLKIFAPPATGENDPSQGDDWQTNYYSTLNKLPDIRIRFAPPALSKD
ncbi:MAG: hypothetical protein IJ416_11510 [Ruminiclostridium sp.]|nr:hypothetical protein [Ruminiclostridium sp.]